MDNELEAKLKNKNTLQHVRNAIKADEKLSPAYEESMDVPKSVVKGRFVAMKLKGEPVSISAPATMLEVSQMVDNVCTLDPSLIDDFDSSAAFNNASGLQKFVQGHCNSTHYGFQISKCVDPSCSYCSDHPIRMERNQFNELSFLPMPLLDDSKKNYLPFSRVYMENHHQTTIALQSVVHQILRLLRWIACTSQCL